MHQARWRGGPWDGTTIEVIEGVPFFPAYAPQGAEPTSAAGRVRLCPVVKDEDGIWVINWDDRLEPPA